MKYFILICLLLFQINFTYAQRILKLEDALSIGLNESYSIKSAELSLINSEKSLEAIKLGLRTSLDLEFDLPRYTNSLISQFNPLTGSEQFFNAGSTVIESRLVISQPLLFSNGTLSISGSLFAREQFSGNSGTSRDYYSNLVFRFKQPLFTFNNLLSTLKKAEINYLKVKNTFEKSKADIIYNITQNFYELFQLKKSLEITEEKVKQTTLAYETASNKYKAGLIAEVDALQLEVDLISGKNDVLNAKRRYEESKNNFKQLIGLPLNEDFDISAELNFNILDPDINQAITLALKNRPELLNQEADITLSQLNLDEIDSRGRIRADISANYGINKNDENYRNIFSNFLETRSVVLTLSVPVWNWGKNKRETESAEASLQLVQLNYLTQKLSIEKDIQTTINKIKSAQARVEVLKKSVELAEKSYNISLGRFNAGNITSFELSQLQLKLTDIKLSNLNALIEYRIAVADLERKTLHKYIY